MYLEGLAVSALTLQTIQQYRTRPLRTRVMTHLQRTHTLHIIVYAAAACTTLQGSVLCVACHVLNKVLLA